MRELFPPSVEEKIRAAGVVAVVTLESAAQGPLLARALRAGGVMAMEITLRTPAGLEGIRRIREQVPDVVVGAGTLLEPWQVEAAWDAGAVFGVSPGFDPKMADAARDVGLPYAPGVCTPTEIQIAVNAGARLLKFFPAEMSGGLAYLKAVAAPFEHLGVSYLPLGGVSPANLAAYLAEKSVAAVGGTWLAPSDLLAHADWQGVTLLAAAATEMVRRSREKNTDTAAMKIAPENQAE